MFEPSSRYYDLPITDLSAPGGRTLRYVTRRFLPQGEEMSLLGEAEVAEVGRIDLLAAQTLGDPEQFWRICDANNAMNPFDLTAERGRVLRIGMGQV